MTILYKQSKLMPIYLMGNKNMGCIEKAYKNNKQANNWIKQYSKREFSLFF